MLGNGAGFWVVAIAFAGSLAFSAVPTPLWTIYQVHDGFSTFMVTVAFAAYTVGVAVSLLLAGHLSDRLGRRRVLITAILVEVAAAVVFLTSTSLGVLIAARVITGIGIGMITATATAYLTELHAAARPGAGRARSDVISTATSLGGFGIGSLVSGLLAEYVTSPLRAPYLVFLGLLVVSAGAVAFTPETVDLAQARPAYRPQRISVPAAARPAYSASAAAAFVAFAVLGLFTSLAPSFVAGTMHHPSRALAGLVAFLVFSAASGTQIALRGVSARRQLATGLLLMSAGLATVTTAVWLPSLVLFLLGGAIAGGGAGVLFKGAISSVGGLAAPGQRGEVLAGVFLAAYTGMAIPVLGLGLASQAVAARTALLGFSVVLIALGAAVGRRLLRR
jgi:MFS family permease